MILTVGRNASRIGFRHQQPHAVTVGGIDWLLIEALLFIWEAAHLGPGREGDCISSDRLLFFHLERVEPANLYCGQCLLSYGVLWID